MDIKISNGNMKLGSLPNFSLTPGKSCAPAACQSCYKDCYARKAYRMYKQTRNAWDTNTELVTQHLDVVEQDLRKYFSRLSAPRFFRIHTSGDFVTKEYAEMWCTIGREFPDTKFLAFTKAFDNVRGLSFSPNFSLVLSGWPGLELPDDLREQYSVAWMQDGTESRVPDNTLECPGNCETCGACWGLNKIHKDVVFHKH